VLLDWLSERLDRHESAEIDVENCGVNVGLRVDCPKRNGTAQSDLSSIGRCTSKETKMAPRESGPQKATVERVMHQFKHGELRSGTGGQKVKNRKQAVAIALSEAGASNQQTPKKNEEHLRHTKAKERRGETAKDEIESKRSHRRSTK
jgi:hypothetical protein